VIKLIKVITKDYDFTIVSCYHMMMISVSFDTLKKNKSNANDNSKIVLHERKSFNYGNAVRSARRTEHYSTCCNSLILLVITEWILTIIQKRLLRQFRHHISYVYRTCKCYLRCIKNRNFGIILFFYNVVPWSIPRDGGPMFCIIALDF
jgi:hypothetical protein